MKARLFRRICRAKWVIRGDVSHKSFKILVDGYGGGMGSSNWSLRLSALAVCLTVAPVAPSTQAFAQAPEGIPRDLARLRAQQLQDVRYNLSYTIIPKADSIAGHEELRFEQNADARGILPEWLDFREGSISKLIINGQSAATTIQKGHVELPAKLLKMGENVVMIDFTAPVAPAGKAITRFEDKDDGSEYIYTLFVPIDADMAFPCFDQPDLKAKFRLTVTTTLNWTVISNTSGTVAQELYVGGNGIRRTEFAETKPISTYLFAFAAGPFKKVHDVAGMPGLYVRKSKLEKAEAEAAAVQQMSLRFAAGSDALAALVRERQDLSALWRDRDNALLAAISQPQRQQDLL